ncbi:MAG: metallophosphoesterase [Bacteroidota bacterium]
MQNRRKFVKTLGVMTATTFAGMKSFAIPATNSTKNAKKTKFGLITDLHHLQFGQDEEARIKDFMDAVMNQNPDFIIQCGDFCRPKGSDGIMAQWNRFKGPKYHVLGNHDMDVCSKEMIMQLWGMEKRYYSFDYNGYHYVIMDRNFLLNDNGTLDHYNNSNWSPLPSPKRSYTDKEQLDWLRKDLALAAHPVIVFMHQPVFVSDFFDELGNANEILELFDEANYNATKQNRSSKISAVFMGHDHDDRYGRRNGVHYFIINSSTYVYTSDGAHYYKDPLYAFITLDPGGVLSIEGKRTVYKQTPPKIVEERFPARISDYNVRL